MKYAIIAALGVALFGCGGQYDEVRSASCTTKSSSNTITVSCREVDPNVANGNVPGPNYGSFQASSRP